MSGQLAAWGTVWSGHRAPPPPCRGPEKAAPTLYHGRSTADAGRGPQPELLTHSLCWDTGPGG